MGGSTRKDQYAREKGHLLVNIFVGIADCH
jgi:hypothetical protein